MITPPPQLTLPLPHRQALDRDAFLVADSNAAAVGWIDRWPAWPTPALVLEGPPGAGKTHLASVWRARAGAGLIDGTALDAAAVPRLLDAGRPLVVEQADRAAEQPLLHLYNGFAERRLSLLLTAGEAPARWGTRLPDLSSRLKALPVAPILAPDDRLVHAVLIKLCADRQLTVPDDVFDFLLARMERSFEAARALVAAIDTTSLATHRPVTVPLVRDVLRMLYPDEG
ncbi:MAG TPA: DNA replication protein [Aliidongia sp.]|nr:DNA replication protein [Aliidongia sp.]